MNDVRHRYSKITLPSRWIVPLRILSNFVRQSLYCNALQNQVRYLRYRFFRLLDLCTKKFWPLRVNFAGKSLEPLCFFYLDLNPDCKKIWIRILKMRTVVTYLPTYDTDPKHCLWTDTYLYSMNSGVATECGGFS